MDFAELAVSPRAVVGHKPYIQAFEFETNQNQLLQLMDLRWTAACSTSCVVEMDEAADD